MSKGKKCFCGHLLKDHGLYVKDGRSNKGSRFVCQKNGCNRWSYCDLSDDLLTTKGTHDR